MQDVKKMVEGLFETEDTSMDFTKEEVLILCIAVNFYASSLCDVETDSIEEKLTTLGMLSEIDKVLNKLDKIMKE
jgi:hypothetical protein